MIPTRCPYVCCVIPSVVATPVTTPESRIILADIKTTNGDVTSHAETVPKAGEHAERGDPNVECTIHPAGGRTLIGMTSPTNTHITEATSTDKLGSHRDRVDQLLPSAYTYPTRGLGPTNSHQSQAQAQPVNMPKESFPLSYPEYYANKELFPLCNQPRKQSDALYKYGVGDKLCMWVFTPQLNTHVLTNDGGLWISGEIAEIQPGPNGEDQFKGTFEAPYARSEMFSLEEVDRMSYYYRVYVLNQGPCERKVAREQKAAHNRAKANRNRCIGFAFIPETQEEPDA
jgi:hypothetical protein